jgi:general L-amino acid transport system permease protein
VNRLAWLFVELMRNVPLLVLLIFIYTAIFLKLPRARQAINIGPIYLSNRGVAIPWGEPTESWSLYLACFAGAIVVAVLVVFGLRWWQARSGRPKPIALPALAVWLGLAAIGWFILPQPPLQLSAAGDRRLQL